MKRSAILLALITATVSLAGCAGDDPAAVEETQVVDKESFQLAAGKGAIAGLLVDDRFRPIDLEDSPETETQFTGFILLQETGEQAQSNENGEFSFVDLEPGTYTVRVTVDGHEAVPQKVKVAEGLFNEASIVARRVLSAGSTIVTEEFSVFIPCAFVLPGVGLFTLNCVLDLSGDSFRSSVDKNYTAYEGLTYVVAELLADSTSNYSMPLRDNGQGCPCYARDDIENGRWGKAIVKNDPEEPYQEGNEPWTKDKNLNIGMFYAGDVDTPVGTQGAKVGIQGDFLISLFFDEPDVDLESYCVICGE